MLPFNHYNNVLNIISSRIYKIKNYSDYCLFELDWEYYYKNIFQINCNKNKPYRLIFCESGPFGNYPNRNYMFDNISLTYQLDSANDKYLMQIYKGVNQGNYIVPTKLEALIYLSTQNILILDILPTHGIKLNTSERRSFVNASMNNNINLYDLGKFHQLLNLNVQITNYLFAVPPTLYYINLLTPILNSTSANFGNVNIGQGHCPSKNELARKILQGF